MKELQRKTKIICTIGPASRNEETIRKLFLAGMNAGRFNFSHGTHEIHEASMALFRKVRDELGVPGAILLDTKGPEIRVKSFKDGSAVINDGSEFTLTTEDVEGNDQICSVTYPHLAADVKAGDHILIDDGKIMLGVLGTTDTEVRTRVLHGGVIKDNKGINIPDVNLKLDYLSEKDKSDILFGIEQGIDFIAASFTRTGDDVQSLRDFLEVNGGSDIKIISKIESTQGIQNFEEILKLSDGIMVARGDMGVEVPFERLPGIQKRFIKRCVQSGKIVITATQMLESMTTSPVPTRAEITDVANAVFDGTSCVMLSGETAAGDFPVESVEAMAKIAIQAENDRRTVLGPEQIWHEMDRTDVTNAVAHAACTLAEDLNAASILAITHSGFTARRIAKFHPSVPVIGAAPTEKTYHQLSMEWGVYPLRTEYKDRLLELYRHCADRACDEGLVEAGDLLVITAGVPMGKSGDTNMIRVLKA